MFLAGGLFALDGAGVSDIGGGSGIVIIEFIMRFMQTIPSFLGLVTIHFVGSAALFLGFVGWLWAAAISRGQWLHLTGQKNSKMISIFRRLFWLVKKVSSVAKKTQKQAISRRLKERKKSKHRQEPVLFGESDDQVDNHAVGRTYSQPKSRVTDEN